MENQTNEQKKTNLAGYYKGCLELHGFKSTFVVYASSSEHAVKKALDDAELEMPGARVHEIEGPYQNIQI